VVGLRFAVIAEARTWLHPHTEFIHQARVKGVGVDCLNLIWGVGEGAGVMPPVTTAKARPFWRYYGRRPNPPKMRECLAQFLVELPATTTPKPGDIAWMHWGNEMPIHMALIGVARDARETLIHSVWNMGVIEHGFTSEFRERVTSYWRYPKIAEAEGVA
jgi:hypothetical protein